MKVNFFFCLCLLLSFSRSGAIEVTDEALRKAVEMLMESSLQHGEMQRYYDSQAFGSQSVEGKNLLDQVAEAFRLKFRERIDALINLRNNVENSDSSDNKQCCELQDNDVRYDPRFLQKVIPGGFCIRKSSNTPDDANGLSDKFRQACVINQQNHPLIKWQYYGSEQGVTTQFPGLLTDQEDCQAFDNRVRPWYVQANVPTAKQVVIAIDTSDTLLQNIALATTVASTLINSSNPRDKLAIIGFNNEVTIRPSGCFSANLAQATTQNVRNLTNFLGELALRFQGTANYTEGLSSAFDFFETSNADENIVRVIVFISGADAASRDTKEIFQTIKARNAALNNSVYLMTFGVGTADFPALQRMALQNGSAYGVSQSPDINAGLFLNVRDVNNVRNQITSYFRHFFSTETANNPVWTVPYLDNWGLGVVISGTLPVTQAGEVLGVAVVDMTLTELLEESTFFQPSEYSYSFIIDRSGLVINHPLFPEVEDTHPLFVEATAYEREEEFLEVFESMKSGFSGNKTFLATRLYSGDMSSPVMTLATYFWKPIDGTPFVTCVVIPNGDKRVFNPSTNLNPIPSFLYHRFDIVPPEYQCVHFNFYLCSNQSSIALSARSFKRVEEFLLTEETENSVTELKNYMEGRGGQPTNLEDDIRDVVKLTLRAESLWINSTQDKNLQLQVVLFRYIGTREGVFRLYPGSQEPKDFDPVTREWYRNALLNRGKYAVTPPYEDVDAGLTVVTISKVIYQGRTDGIHTPNDTVVGVMGLDIVLSYFNDLIVNLYPLCGESNYRCLLIDNAGYVIWSDQVSSLNAINLHLSFPGGGSIPTVEPQIMNALIRDGLAVVKRCANIDDATLERKYEIIAHEQTTVTTNGGISASCFQFTLTPIRETNSFLIVREDGGSQGDCNQLDNTCRRCSPNGICVAALSVTDNTICECPCRTSNLDYNACTNQYQNSYPQIFPCSPTNQARLSNFTMGSVSGLPKCFAVVDSPSPSTPKGTDNIGLIAGCVVAGVVFVIFIVIAVVLFKKNKSKNEHKNKNELKYQNENSTQAPASSSQTVGIQKVDVASYENPLGEHSENDVYDEYITMEEQNNYRNIII